MHTRWAEGPTVQKSNYRQHLWREMFQAKFWVRTLQTDSELGKCWKREDEAVKRLGEFGVVIEIENSMLILLGCRSKVEYEGLMFFQLRVASLQYWRRPGSAMSVWEWGVKMQLAAPVGFGGQSASGG